MDETGVAATDLPQARLDSTWTHPVPGRMIAADLAPLWFVRYPMRLVPRAPLVLPLHGRGAILRGAFGLTVAGIKVANVAPKKRELKQGAAQTAALRGWSRFPLFRLWQVHVRRDPAKELAVANRC